jgi:hypothetical protein
MGKKVRRDGRGDEASGGSFPESATEPACVFRLDRETAPARAQSTTHHASPDSLARSCAHSENCIIETEATLMVPISP